MAELPPIAVVLTADTSDFTQGINKANREISGLDEPTKRTNKSLGLLKFAAVGAAAVIAAKGVMDFASSAVRAAQESLVADRRLDQIAESMGYVDGKFAGTTDRLKEFASTLSTTIGVEDESIKATQGVLLTFANLGDTANQVGGMFDRATKAAYDLASAGFGSAEGNAKQLGKALNDPIKGISALAKAGVTFTAQEKEKIKTLVESNKIGEAQALVMAAIEKQVGGTAEATTTGIDRMKVAFGELKEAIGGPLAAVMTEIADAITPILNELQGPLSEVAKSVGGALKDAFAALSPILPTLAKAIAQIAETLGTLLASAIQILVPIVTPLLEMFSDMAQKLLPRLQPLLIKLGEIFNKIMQALMPLLPPLMDLVFTILDAAIPIIDMVADVFLTLISALSPIIGIVASLLPVLGTLINTLFKAIMPVLKPVLPLIEQLAVLFGDLLARAIGVIVTAIGGMIVAFSKIAPFVLNNVTKPVLEMFLNFAEGIVEAAANAFSWIPGLGDKLNSAKDAISTFKTSATTAISEAATTIGVEGEKIGKGLIDQGVNLMKDPSSLNKVQTAAKGVGLAMGDGMTLGLKTSMTGVNNAAAATVDSAERAARAAARSQSPSELFADIGRDLTKGLVQGVRDGGKEVEKTLKEAYGTWFDNTIEMLKGKLEDAKSAFNDFRDSVSSAIRGAFDFGDAFSGAKDRAKAIADAEKAYAEAAEAAQDPKATDSDRKKLVNAEADLAFARSQGEKLGINFMDSLRAQAAQAIEFAAKVKELIKMGLSREAITMVLQAGLEAGTNIANELITGGATTIQETNELVDTTKAAADEVGVFAAENFFQTGVDSATETLRGFREQFGKGGPAYKRLQALMDNLADSMKRETTITVTTIRREVIETIQAPAAASPPRRALGGPVFSDRPYMVGEFGPEIFVPNGVSGTIVPSDKIGDANQTINVYAQTNANAHDISREIAWTLKVGV